MATRNTTSTVLSVLLALLFLASGATKLVGMDMQVQGFERWDYPIWFMYVTGLLEVLGGLLLFAPATRFAGSLLLASVMVGATGTHVMNGEIAVAGVPALLALCLAWIVWRTRGPYIEPSSQHIAGDKGAEEDEQRFAV